MNYLCVYCLSYLTFVVTNGYSDGVVGVISPHKINGRVIRVRILKTNGINHIEPVFAYGRVGTKAAPGVFAHERKPKRLDMSG